MEAQKLSALYGVETIAAEQTAEILATLSRLLERLTPQPGPEGTPAEKILRKAHSHMTRIIEVDQQGSS